MPVTVTQKKGGFEGADAGQRQKRDLKSGGAGVVRNAGAGESGETLCLFCYPKGKEGYWVDKTARAGGGLSYSFTLHVAAEKNVGMSNEGEVSR